jgi:dihydropteroate synthase
LVELASETAQGEQEARAVGGESVTAHVGRGACAVWVPDACAVRVPGACAVWGVLNVTPDSFSDGGSYADAPSAVAAGLSMLEAGASVLDVGGESTRPRGKTYGEDVPPVPLDEELRRVVPVVRALSARGATVSIDTTKPEVARQAFAAGARILNDVGCGRSPELLAVAAGAQAELVLMHNRGQGERRGANIQYADVTRDVLDELSQAVGRAVRAGVSRERIWIDPGIGFAKTAAQSLTLLARTDALVQSGLRVLVGPSRKSFIAEVAKLPSGESPGPLERLGGTSACVAIAVLLGAHAVRVHDVSEMRQAALLAAAMRGARANPSGTQVTSTLEART